MRRRYYGGQLDITGYNLFQSDNLIVVNGRNGKALVFDYSNDRKMKNPIASLPFYINCIWWDTNINKYRILKEYSNNKLWQSADGIIWNEESLTIDVRREIVILPNGQYIGFSNTNERMGYAWISNNLTTWQELSVIPFQEQVVHKVIMKSDNNDEIIFLEGGWAGSNKRVSKYSLSQQSIISTVEVQNTGRLFANPNCSLQTFNNDLVIVSSRIYSGDTLQKLWKTADGINFTEIGVLPYGNNEGDFTQIIEAYAFQMEEVNKIMVVAGSWGVYKAYFTDYQGSYWQEIGISFSPYGGWDSSILKTDDALIYMTQEQKVKRILI